jgi:cytochrome P450
MKLGFMAMDDPLQAQQRMTLMPLMTPSTLQKMGESIRARTRSLLQSLPLGEPFNWVDEVSIPLTTRMLSILLDFPYDEEKILPAWTLWSTDVDAGAHPVLSKRRQEILEDMGIRLRKILEAKKQLPPTGDVLSIMAHSATMADMSQEDFQGLMSLIVVGGNDTTRNSMTALIQVMDQFPEEWDKVRRDRSLATSAIQETIRWWSPVAHQRRTAVCDTELGGKQIRKGDKVVLWFKSGNYDESAFSNPEKFDISRDNVRRHIAFGFGIHRCFGARLGELQVTILLEEILNLGLTIKPVAAAVRSDTCMINGFEEQMVVVDKAAVQS